MDSASDEPDATEPLDSGPVGPIHVGSTVASYLLLKELGHGATATVYLARNKEGKECAVKVLLPRFAESGRLRRRLVREARVLGDLAHPNLVKILDAGGPPFFLVTEYVPGETLAELIRRRGPIPQEEAAELMAQLARGLAAAHRAGIVHRDLKPANVILTPVKDEVRAKLLDFGLARALQDEIHGTAFTHINDLIGTPAYMSPEQIRDPSQVGPTSDLYSLGLIGYELLMGTRPTLRPARKALLLEADLEAPPLPGKGPMESLIMQLLDIDPLKRPSSADEVLRALEAVLPPTSELTSTVAGRSEPRSDTPLLEPSITRTPFDGLVVENTKITTPVDDTRPAVKVVQSTPRSFRWLRMAAAAALIGAAILLVATVVMRSRAEPKTIPIATLRPPPVVEIAPRVAVEAIPSEPSPPPAVEPPKNRPSKPRPEPDASEQDLRQAVEQRGLRLDDLPATGLDPSLLERFRAALGDRDSAAIAASWAPLQRAIRQVPITPPVVRRRLERVRAQISAIAGVEGPERIHGLEARYFVLRGDIRDDSDPAACERLLRGAADLERELKGLTRAK